MPGYLNSAQMLLECDYQQAAALLQDGQFEQARELFSSLADQNYADADQQVLECDYRQARGLFNRNSFLGAASIFNMLYTKYDYKDSGQYADDSYFRLAGDAHYENDIILSVIYYGQAPKLNQTRWQALFNELIDKAEGRCRSSAYTDEEKKAYYDAFSPYTNRLDFMKK